MISNLEGDWHGIVAITVHSACFNAPLAKNLFGLYQSWISDVQLHMYLNTHGMHWIWHMTHVPQSQLKNQITQSKSAHWGTSTHQARITQWVRAWRLLPPSPLSCSNLLQSNRAAFPEHLSHTLRLGREPVLYLRIPFFGVCESRLLMVSYICSENTSTLLCGVEEHLSNIWDVSYFCESELLMA